MDFDSTIDLARRTCGFALDVAFLTAGGAARGASRALSLTADVIGDASLGDFSKAGDRIEAKLRTQGSRIGASIDQLSDACSKAADGAPASKILTKRNAAAAASLLTLGLAAYIGADAVGLIGDDSSE